ncbi:hydroxyproline-rich glycoprotein family protein [Trifolium medium]|uniref:Hydroxyproline-rich glycoprotein family protein n=1 Tax=Trifolium medium TaxID=97028 RepID=A0A392M439_9FABA|nr:hydroxyproline-rich glycoprotein family protein [Trifolium medium]
MEILKYHIEIHQESAAIQLQYLRKRNLTQLKNSAPRLSASASSHDLWHSSHLEEKKNGRDFVDGKLSEPAIPRAHSILKESNSDTTSAQLPRPSTEGQSHPQVDIFNASDTKKIKRHAFSGPLTNKPLSVKPVSGGFPRLPIPQPSSPKASPGASPPLVSSPRISELHELPRPPGNQTSKATKSSRIGHSAPLGLRNPEHPAINKFPPVVSSSASPLPTPPITVSRSFSIPSSSQRAVVLNVTNKYLHTHQIPEKVEEVASPPLTPLSQRVSTLPELASHSSEIQVVVHFHIDKVLYDCSFISGMFTINIFLSYSHPVLLCRLHVGEKLEYEVFQWMQVGAKSHAQC